jgi:hypothetical protein
VKIKKNTFLKYENENITDKLFVGKGITTTNGKIVNKTY